MNTKEYTFDASILNEKRIVKGCLKLSINGLEFVDSSNIRKNEKINWRKIKYTTGTLDIPVFLFISSQKEYIKFEADSYESSKYIIDNKLVKEIISVIDEFREELFKIEKEKIAKEEAERKIREAKERARMEAERKSREEAGQKKQRTEQNKVCQKVSELSYSKHTQYTENVFEYDENNPMVKELMYVARKYHYDFETETDGILVFRFLSSLVSSDDPGEFLDTNGDALTEIEVLMNFANVSASTIRRFENIINLLSEYEVLEIDYITDILDQIYSEINNVYHPDIRVVKEEVYETKDYITHEWMDVKRQLREEEARFRKDKYDKALEYIKKQNFPFKKDALKKATGAPDGVIRYVFRNENKIVNYYREYIWYDNLGISQYEEKLLLAEINQIVDDYDVHHIQEIYENLLVHFSTFFKRIMVTTPYRLLGLLRVIPGGNMIYNIEQPYIAGVGVKITTAEERLQDFIRYKDKVSVSAILQYARDNYMHVQSIIELLNSLNRTHVFLNKYEMIRTSKVIISSAMEKEIIRVFEDELKRYNGLMAICQMEHAHELPEIDYEWNEWLLYSIMLKRKRCPEVFLSSNTFSEAIPMVSNRCQYSNQEVSKIAEECKNRELKVADNMNNIDELLEDMIDDFIEDIEF